MNATIHPDICNDTHIPWNIGRLVGQKKPLKPNEIWAIRTRLQITVKIRDLALFNPALDSTLRGCDIVKLRVNDISSTGKILSRAMVMQQKTGQPVRFEITEQTREAVEAWIQEAQLRHEQFLFSSRKDPANHITTRQYVRIVKSWVNLIGLESSDYATHSLRSTKATLIYRRTKNLRAVQLLLGHTKIESTVRYLGIEVDDVLEIAEQTEI